MYKRQAQPDVFNLRVGASADTFHQHLEKEAGLLKQEIKIVLPAYKIFYSLFFPVVLCLIRGVARADEIGGALDSNMALLSLVFCAETWVMERSGRRWEILDVYKRQGCWF